MANLLTNRVRVGGSGFTVFTWMNQPIAFAQEVAHTSPQPVSEATPIHPMDEPYPIQVITPAASSMGSLVLNLFELVGERVWDRLGAVAGAGAIGKKNDGVNPSRDGLYNANGGDNNFLKNAVDLVDIFIRVAERPNTINVTKIIRQQPGASRTGYDVENYHNCVITNVIDGEQINVGTMEVIKQVTVAYTHMTRGGGLRSKAWDLRAAGLPSGISNTATP